MAKVTDTPNDHEDRFPAVRQAIDSLDDDEQQIALVRLAAKYNNGSEHFDHSPVGSSWLCLACRCETVVEAHERAQKAITSARHATGVSDPAQGQ